MTQKRTVVVDGSNLATEGRTLPSLVQLDECVTAFADETPHAEIIVVVDATFEHRIDERERKRFKEAELAGEIVTPPAGAIGRGDAFILKIAARTNAVVLSNDSFQEFHGEHPWLFDEDRLIGGKPIPGVGWVFTPRNPVRGPKSRESRARHAEPATGAMRDASPAKPRRAVQKATAAVAAPPLKRAARATATKAVAKKVASPRQEKPVSATKKSRSTKKASSATTSVDATESARATRTPRKATVPAKAPGVEGEGARRPARATGTAKRGSSVAAPAEAAAKGTRRRSKAVDATATPAEKPKAAATDAATRASKREGAGPVNTPRAFNALVKEHPLRSKVEGDVVAFTSHGATISIAVGKGMEAVCYAPLARLGRPAPTRARDVLKKGERREFKVVAFDNERRIAEVSIV